MAVAKIEEAEKLLEAIFKDPRNRIKGAVWWLLSVCSGNSAYACYVSNSGHAGGSHCSYALRVPVCFSIKIKE